MTALEHKTTVRRSGGSVVARCTTEDCAKARPDEEPWELEVPGTSDASKLQAQRAAAVHRGESVRSV